MKSRIIISLALIIVGLVAASIYRHKHAQAQWLENARQTLASRNAPTADIVHTFRSGNWAGQGYLTFSNGWASFDFHTFHDSEKIGDIALLRTSDGVYYTSHFHFCVGETEFSSQPQPRDISQFLEIYGAKQGWTK
jgi:hypothetical protein